MAEIADQREQKQPNYREYGGRIRSYGFIGFLLLLTLVAAVLLAYFQVQGPQLVFLDVAVWVLALVVFMMALCLLYVLFTLRGALRLVRSQATEVAVVRALAHRHEIVERVPPAAIEYTNPNPAKVQAPTAQYVPAMAPSRNVEVLEGIGPVFRERLAKAGIESLRDLRAASAQRVADAAGVSPMIADRWKAMADLLVVREVDPQGAELLVACNIYTVEGLAAQDPDTLYRRCSQVNSRGDNRIVPGDVTQERVQKWVTAARRYGADATPNQVPRGDEPAAAQASA